MHSSDNILDVLFCRISSSAITLAELCIMDIDSITAELSKMDLADKLAHVGVGLTSLYSLTLAGWRHSVFEDLGIFDTIFEVMSNLLLLMITVRTRDMKETDKQVYCEPSNFIFAVAPIDVVNVCFADCVLCNFCSRVGPGSEWLFQVRRRNQESDERLLQQDIYCNWCECRVWL